MDIYAIVFQLICSGDHWRNSNPRWAWDSLEQMTRIRITQDQSDKPFI
jgi:hypothetical protein